VRACWSGKYSVDARHRRTGPVSTAILDIDGTLVDTNYHHTIAWARALQRFDIDVALWRIHRHIGMGGDQVVASLCGQEVEDEHGDEIRSAESEEYMRLIGEVRPMQGARDLIIALRERGHAVVLASSAKEDEVDVYLDLLDAREVVDAWTTSADVESTKPAPDLVHAALDKTGDAPSEAVMVGDTPWDVKAASKAGVETITVITGGFSEQQLTEAGAVAVFESVAELLERLDETRLKQGDPR
jgi:HAD superfamily hydrolase (TIGR01509 family)